MVRRAIDFTEKLFLLLIAGFTVVSMGQEILLLVTEAVAMVLIYEASAILLIAAACWIISRMRDSE